LALQLKVTRLVEPTGALGQVSVGAVENESHGRYVLNQSWFVGFIRKHSTVAVSVPLHPALSEKIAAVAVPLGLILNESENPHVVEKLRAGVVAYCDVPFSTNPLYPWIL
jgi:hypothetical protein